MAKVYYAWRANQVQARRVSGSDVRQQIQFINKLFEVAA